MPFFIILLLIITPLFAEDLTDLRHFIKELELSPAKSNIPPLPKYKEMNTNYIIYDQKDLFDQKNIVGLDSKYELQKYSLDQLKMVGFMQYQNHNYAFLKTPYEIISVKVGDKIRDGVINTISKDSVQIDEMQLQDGHTYTRKIFLKLIEPPLKTFSKLQTT